MLAQEHAAAACAATGIPGKRSKHTMRHPSSGSAIRLSLCVTDAAAHSNFVLEIVRRTNAEPGFGVPPGRWVVERTFGWLTGWHRLEPL